MIIVWVAIYIAISLSFGRNFQNFSMVRSSKLNVLNGKIADVIGNIGNVRLFSRYKFEEKYLGKYQSEEQEAYRKSLIYNSYMECWLGLANVIFLFAMVGGAIYLYQEGKITLGDVALVLSYHSLLSLVWYIGMELIVFYEILGSCNEALSLLREPYSIVDKEDASNLKVSEGKIEFRQVVFNYSSKNKIFNNESVLIPGRQKVGLVGFSGSGKTTFVNLLLRYFDVKSGAILIDNQDIKDVTQSSLREAIAVIPQEPTLFHRSLIENIRYGKLEATDEEVIRAAQLAHAHEFIENLPESYQTLVGERGTKLSGGQRQRIAIARAILKNAPILVLDEATSALDSITEGKIQESLHSLMADKTVIVIAHRLSTLLNMDRILVFNNGVIVEEGSHEELLAREGIYTSLWNMQGSGFVTDEEEGTGE
jgi:ATP-binding cassette subfamily B protein